MEAKTGCVRRDRACRKAMEQIRISVKPLLSMEDGEVVALAKQIMNAADGIKE